MQQYKDLIRLTGMTAEGQQKQFLEEASELLLAIKADNKVAILDGIGDCIFVLNTLWVFDRGVINVDYNIYYNTYFEIYYNITNLIDLQEDYYKLITKIVLESNMTKFDICIEDANKTVDKYTSLGLNVETKLDKETGLWVTKSLEDKSIEINGEMKHFHKGKFLKSAVNYKEPDFTEILTKLNGN